MRQNDGGIPYSSFPLRRVARVVAGALVFCLILLVRGYQALIRPLLVGACRFQPSCSEYAVEALRMHGPWRGGRLALRRLARCTPWSRCGGIDPVPRAS